MLFFKIIQMLKIKYDQIQKGMLRKEESLKVGSSVVSNKAWCPGLTTQYGFRNRNN